MTAIVAEVGRFYMVPCMFVERSFRTFWIPRDGWVPVLGPRHTDAEHLKFPHEHYHIDWRFIPAPMFSAASEVNSVPHGRVLTKTTAGGLDGQPVLKRRLCRRVMPEHPPIRRISFGWKALSEGRGPTGWQHLERDHACARLKPGGICPHRGIDLTPFARPDGTAICPGHGLRWNLHTGELMAHHNEARSTPCAT